MNSTKEILKHCIGVLLVDITLLFRLEIYVWTNFLWIPMSGFSANSTETIKISLAGEGRK